MSLFFKMQKMSLSINRKIKIEETFSEISINRRHTENCFEKFLIRTSLIFSRLFLPHKPEIRDDTNGF